ncbi:hypothetical protein KEG38_24060 [Polyangium jinanense]|uniref:hypothetical protein n=1 Tax=Polyangium jinanense TaxID=2829994 RepID=UPI002341A8B1|nr:hypothetical protein [Polyangium jinanense]MDC3956957.1 hypothetical protein [Polyangium jinanense]
MMLDERDSFLSELLRAVEQAHAQVPGGETSDLRVLVLDAWGHAHHAFEAAASPDESGPWIARSLGARTLFERLGARFPRSGYALYVVFAIAERLSFPVRERVLDIAARHVEARSGEERLSWLATLARLSHDDRRDELLREVDAGILSLPELKHRVAAAAERLGAAPEGATRLVREAINWLLACERLPPMARRFLARIPESDWAALPPDEAREVVARWQADTDSFWERTAPLRVGHVPGWLKAELEQSLLREAMAMAPSDRLCALSELVEHIRGAARASISQALLAEPAPVLRAHSRAVRRWAPVATVEELHHLERELLPLMEQWDDEALLALTERAAALGEMEPARAFQTAIVEEETRRYGRLSIVVRSGPFEEVERLLGPYLHEEEASGDLPWVAEELRDDGDIARFAEVIATAASGANRLSAWAVAFPRLSEAQRQALAPAVSLAIEDALRAPPEESDSSLYEMLPWLSEENLLAIWKRRADPAVWQPTGAETTRLFSYDRGYVHPEWLSDIVLRLGGEETLVAWAQAEDQVEAWISGRHFGG